MANTWLFVRGNHSVRLLRTANALLVMGPGTQRAEHALPDDAAIDSLQTQIETNLRRQGWVFEGYAVERRGGVDRRSIPRWTGRRSQHEDHR